MSVEQKGFESLLRSNEGIAIASILGGLTIVLGSFLRAFRDDGQGYVTGAIFYDPKLLRGELTYLPMVKIGSREVTTPNQHLLTVTRPSVMDARLDLSNLDSFEYYYRYPKYDPMFYPEGGETFQDERAAVREIEDIARREGFAKASSPVGMLKFVRTRCTLHDDCIEHPELGAACLEDQKKNPDRYVMVARSKQ